MSGADKTLEEEIVGINGESTAGLHQCLEPRLVVLPTPGLLRGENGMARPAPGICRGRRNAAGCVRAEIQEHMGSIMFPSIPESKTERVRNKFLSTTG